MGPVTAAVIGVDKLPLDRYRITGDDDFEAEKPGYSVIRLKNASNRDYPSRAPVSIPNKPGDAARPLDWRLGKKINALIDMGTSGIVLGEGRPKDLKFEWLITPWTECSQPCGMGVGFRVSLQQCHSLTAVL